MDKVKKAILRQLQHELNYMSQDYKQWVMALGFKDSTTVRVVVKTSTSSLVDGGEVRFSLEGDSLKLNLDDLGDPIYHGGDIQTALEWVGNPFYLSIKEPVSWLMEIAKANLAPADYITPLEDYTLEARVQPSLVDLVSQLLGHLLRVIYPCKDIGFDYSVEGEEVSKGRYKLHIHIKDYDSSFKRSVLVKSSYTKATLLEILGDAILTPFLYPNEVV